MNAITETFKKRLLEEKKVFIAARTSKLQPGTAEKILKKIVEKYQLESRDEALTALTILFQQGGTARSCDGNMSITVFGIEYKLADIRKILKAESCNRAERKLARSLATEIYEIAAVINVPGNLYSKIQKQNVDRNFSDEEKAWLSDFQSDNEDCPAHLRSLILDTFKKKETKKKR